MSAAGERFREPQSDRDGIPSTGFDSADAAKALSNHVNFSDRLLGRSANRQARRRTLQGQVCLFPPCVQRRCYRSYSYNPCTRRNPVPSSMSLACSNEAVTGSSVSVSGSSAKTTWELSPGLKLSMNVKGFCSLV